jgi:hypothetical protein
MKQAEMVSNTSITLEDANIYPSIWAEYGVPREIERSVPDDHATTL